MLHSAWRAQPGEVHPLCSPSADDTGHPNKKAAEFNQAPGGYRPSGCREHPFLKQHSLLRRDELQKIYPGKYFCPGDCCNRQYCFDSLRNGTGVRTESAPPAKYKITSFVSHHVCRLQNRLNSPSRRCSSHRSRRRRVFRLFCRGAGF